jgi:alkanesulfonate monooxygenase SsuD/methylene tetrahydromethanopterin reductase-like flavin-dependent oxidoreductase (luciferase family)
MTLQFGLFDHIEGIVGASMHDVLQGRLELVKTADEAGFFAYHLAEHHGSDLCLTPNQEIFLAAAAQVTKQIRLGPLVKILPIHHPLRVIEDICILDQLSGGRVEYGVGRGIAPIEHYWFDGDWFASREKFEDALGIVAEGLRTGRVDSVESKFYDFPEIEVTLDTFQKPMPPFWYPGNATVAGRHGMGLVWPGEIPEEAHAAYLDAWHNPGDAVRVDGPNSRPRVASTVMLGLGNTVEEARRFTHLGYEGLFRRVRSVHVHDSLVLTPEEIVASKNPLQAIAELPMDHPILEQMVAEWAGTPEVIVAKLKTLEARGLSDYVVLQLPTGDQSFAEAKHVLEMFITEVMPAFAPAATNA